MRCTNKIFHSSYGYSHLGGTVINNCHFHAVTSVQRWAEWWDTPATWGTWLSSGMLLGQKVSLCTVVGRAGGVSSPKASMNPDCQVQTHFVKAQELEKRRFHGWTHMVLLHWQVLHIWTSLWRLTNHWKCLSKVNEQTSIQFNEYGMSFVKCSSETVPRKLLSQRWIQCQLGWQINSEIDQ